MGYEKLCELSRELQLLKDTEALLSWDQEVLMPSRGVAHRGKQMAWISGYLHEKFTQPKVGDWIEEAADCQEEIKAANLREWRHAYNRATRLPTALVEEFAAAQVRAKAVWAEARKDSDFARFAPELNNLIDLSQRQADHWGYENCLYDALLDSYERGMTSSVLDKTLGSLRDDLVPVVEEAISSAKDSVDLRGHCPIDEQKRFNHKVAEAMGFDFTAGRIDTAVHPFCSGMGPGDTRLTTRYDENDFLSSLFGVLHEAGHGIYEQGLPSDKHHGEPIGHAVSLGIHESQSRLWENHVGRSLPFWEVWLPIACDHFPHLKKFGIEEVYRAVNRAEKSYIRVEADEVTYDLHILLRYEMEKLLFSGELAVEEVPDEWNRRFQEMFGLEVDCDANGCLQDIHWSMGIFGYFPTYSLGNINAAHLCAAARDQNPSLAQAMDSGDFNPLLDWMRKHIHEKGSLYLPNDLIKKASGTTASAEALVAHLQSRYVR